MAEKCVEKLHGIVECPICLQTLTDPKALQCLHFFCQPCIEDLKTVKEGGKIGVHCPLCRQFTAKEQLRKMPLMQELLEAVALSQKEQNPCERCETEKATWRCGDCKENYCAPCRQQHDGFKMFRNHKCKELARSDRPLVDKHVSCPKHPEEFVKLHCKDCRQLICIICNGTTHKTHVAETIQEAIDEVLPIIKQHRDTIEKHMKTTSDALVRARKSAGEVKQGYVKIQDEIKQNYEKALQKVHDDYKKVNAELATFHTKQEEELDDEIKALELKLKGQKSVLQWSDATLATAQGTSLLCAIESGMIDSLAKDAQEKPILVHCSTKPNAQLVSSEDNVVGKVVQHLDKHSMWIPFSLTDMRDKAITLVSTKKTDVYSLRFSMVANTLWCVNYFANEIHIYSASYDRLNKLTINEFGRCRSVVETNNKVIVAAEKGLFTTDVIGAHPIKLLDGQFCDVSVAGDEVYALDNGAGKVITLANVDQTNSYVKLQEIVVTNYNSHPWNTIQATREYVYLGQYCNYSILQYNKSGEFIATLGCSGNGLGQLRYPHLCGADPEGTLLVADSNNYRFQTVTAKGVWNGLNLDRLSQYPRCAIVSGDKLIVRSGYPFEEYSIQ